MVYINNIEIPMRIQKSKKGEAAEGEVQEIGGKR
jgi:hypothetical protein